MLDSEYQIVIPNKIKGFHRLENKQKINSLKEMMVKAIEVSNYLKANAVKNQVGNYKEETIKATTGEMMNIFKR